MAGSWLHPLVTQGGNDYEIFTHERTIGHAVSSPEDTLRLLDELFPVPK